MRNYPALISHLRNVKAASAQTAAVPEKDPADKGKPAEPAIVDAAKTQATEPAGAATNKNTNDSPANPTAAPATTVTVPEKAASLTTRAAALAGTIGSILKSAKKADAPAAVPATPEEKDKADAKAKAEADAKAAAPAAPAATAATEKAAPAPTVTPGTDAPKGSETAKNTDTKAAASSTVVVPDEFTSEFHAKIGSVMLETAEGRAAAEQFMRMKHGAEMAQDIIKAAAFMEEHALALQQAELEGASAAEQLASEMSAEDLKVASTLAEYHAYDLSQLTTPEEQAAYKAAAAQAAEMADAGAGGMDELPPEAQGAGAEQVTEEDILQVVEFLLSQGKISPEEAQKIVEELQSGAGAEGGAPAEDPNMPPEQKEAMAKIAKAEQDFDALVEAAIK